jgi:hypothetical protein
MKLKLDRIIQSKQSLEVLMKQEFPIVISFKMAKNLKLISEELKVFEEAKNKAITNYGTEKDGHISIAQNSKEHKKYIEEMNELLNTEIDLDLNTTSIELLKDTKLTTGDMMNIDFLFTE